ncbi:MAG: SusD/RagB family nutrient-binding outer membrane lipoprotein [Bacteroidetes bacterium]|nr:MAG: SusD/RagB family nutrient-binding outer membrane lipoprotein [Bacteroidota bacterium]
MKFTNYFLSIFLLFSLLLLSCNKDLTEINENPNGVDPNTAHPNMLISTVMTGIATSSTSRGYASDTGAGAQYVQKDSWSANRYDWSGSSIWSTNYNLLRTNKLANERAVELELEFHEGVTLVLRAMLFGTLTDYYGDIPYTAAIQGDEDDGDRPTYDTQETVYRGIIADLETAAVLLSGNDYKDVSPSQDVFYNGDASKWQKLANSLALRYYMRLSEKLPSFAGTGVTATLSKPLISSVDDECVLAYIGGVESQSWPNSGQFGSASDFYRVKPCATLSDKLMDLADPRLDIWFDQVDIQIQVVPAASMPSGGATPDETVDDVRYINADSIGVVGVSAEHYALYAPETYAQDVLDGKVLVDTRLYVGLPVAVSATDPYSYNLNPNSSRGGTNPHVSRMNPTFNEKSGELLKSRLFSYAELSFLKAEAALKGWGTDAAGNYNAGVQASLDIWGVGEDYADYIDNVGVAFDGSLEMVMEQKWIANMFNGDEAYLDWRRTGLPAFNAGPFAREDVMPLRFVYSTDEININTTNYMVGAASLVETAYSSTDPNDSPYAEPWIVQGVSPW